MGNFERTAVTAVLLCGGFVLPVVAQAQEAATGVVFEDRNGNGILDAGEPGIPGVAVSNGRDVVLTGEDGSYELPVTEDAIIFVTKPSGYAVPLDENKLPQFYYIHKPEGSPQLYYPGVKPTGPLPQSVDFALLPVEEPDTFSAIVFADPQPESYDELYHMQDKVLSELIGTEARFGIVLGEMMFDHLNMFPDYIRVIGTVDIPFYHVVGNHDLNRDAPDNETSTETYQRYFGPVDFSWQSGRVHFVSMNNIKWHGRERGGYHTGLDEHQLQWLANDLAAADEDMLVVICVHGPLYNIRSGRRITGFDGLMELLEDRPGVLALSGHTHVNNIYEIKEEQGWRGSGRFEELNSVTVSGSWWSGPRDHRGVPLGLQSDGTPPGYTLIDFDGIDYTIHYKGGQLPSSHQMSIHPPGTHYEGENALRTLLANVYYAPMNATVEYRLNGGEWRPMVRERHHDPLARALMTGILNHGKPIAGSVPLEHMWAAEVPEDLPRFGPNRWEVRATLPDGRVLEGARSHTPR